MLILLRQAAIFSIIGIGTTLVAILGELDISFGATWRWPVASARHGSSAARHPVVGIVIAVAIGAVDRPRQRCARQLRAHPVGRRHARHARRRRGPGDDVHRRLEHLRRRPRAALVPRRRTRCSASRPGGHRVRDVRRRVARHDAAPGSAPTSTRPATTARPRTGRASPCSASACIVFVVAGALAGFGGLMQAARIGRAQATMGADALFPVLTAVILGGVSLHGRAGPDRQHADRLGVPRLRSPTG